MTQTKPLTIQELIEKMPSPHREIARDVLLPNNAIVLRGLEIHIRLSEIDNLPPNTPDRHYNVHKVYENAIEKKGRVDAGNIRIYSATSVLCLTKFEGKGALEGYFVNVYGKTINPHDLPIQHPVFGTIANENPIWYRWDIGEGVVRQGHEHVYTVAAADARQYVYMLFSHIDSQSPIFNKTIGGVVSNVGLLSYRDEKAQYKTPRDAKRAANEAWLKIDSMNASQAENLKVRMVATMSGVTENLRKATSKDTKVMEMQALTDKYGAKILELIDEIGDVEVPTDVLAKTLLAHAIQFKVLEAVGSELLIAPEYEDRFKGITTEVKIGEGAGMRKRLQFHEAAKPSIISAYVGENPESSQVSVLDGIVSELRNTFREEDVAKGGNPSWNGIISKYGFFRKD